MIPQVPRKIRQTKLKIIREKEIIQIRTDINETGTKIQRINETKSWLFEKNTINKPMEQKEGNNPN
jgi:hypothetical protein